MLAAPIAMPDPSVVPGLPLAERTPVVRLGQPLSEAVDWFQRDSGLRLLPVATLFLYGCAYMVGRVAVFPGSTPGT